MNISIIVPVYNVEPYIEHCLRSIMNQTFTDGVECILINDCTPDNSMQIAKRMIEEYNGNISFRIISHECNKGTFAVRNTGLDAAIGTYLIYIDSDDYIETNMLEKMYKKALKSDADIVIADFWETNGVSEKYIKQNFNQEEEPLRLLLALKIRGVLWNKMFKRSLYIDNKIRFENNINIGEDLIVCLKLFYLANKIVYIPLAFVHYRKYYGSISSRSSLNNLKDLLILQSFIIKFFQERGLYEYYQREITMRIILYYRGLLFGTKGNLQKKVNKHCMELVSAWDIIKYGDILSLYWRVATLMASVSLLPIFNLMRTLWGYMRLEYKKNLVFYDEKIEL